MISRLRWRLTFWFIFLVLIVYLIDAGFAYWLTDQRLTLAIDDDLKKMCEELVSDVAYPSSGSPSLRNRGTISLRHHSYVGMGVQLFDVHGRLLEQYGQIRSQTLINGRVGKDSQSTPGVYSYFSKLSQGGFVQVQMSAFHHDQSLRRFVISKLLRVIATTIIVGICGWYYSGKVLEPIVRSLKTLRTFVDNAGHELKTPVTIIENGIETVESYLEASSLPTSALHKIQRASARLKGLATNMILLARMEQPAVQLSLADVELGQIAADVEGELTDMAAGKDIVLHVDLQQNLMFKADREAITIMLSNLVRNALQYTLPGGVVTLSGGKADEGHLFVTVQDTGEGIPEESLPFIFDRFYRIDQSRSRDMGGSGLGLAIVKAIIDLHGGTIRVDSKVGRGTIFKVLLPLQQPTNPLSLNVNTFF